VDGGRGHGVGAADRTPALPGGRLSALVDTHAHLHDPAFDADRTRVIARARAAGVAGFLTIGTDVATSEAAVALAAAEPDVYAAVGIHPHDARTADAAALRRIAALARMPRVVAVGEIGLDYYRDLSPRVAQRTALVAQIELARAVGKPVLLHCREAHADLLDVCLAEGVAAVGGILHCFSGDLEVARRGLGLGLLISIAGPVTYPSARRLVEVVRALPLESLVVETDCPYLPPQPWRGQRNEPAYLPVTAARVAELLGVAVATIAAATTENAARVLGLPSSLARPAAPLT
jgi:TatD DNase family protein